IFIVLVVMLGLLLSGNCVNGQIDGYIAGEDYPAYDAVPQGLSFNCQGRQPGYYADTETRCQVWHWCLHSGHQYSFLCPNGTVFNQAVRVCDWWSNVNCANSEQLYQNNDELYRIPERNQQQQQQHDRQTSLSQTRSSKANNNIDIIDKQSNNSKGIVDNPGPINYNKMTKNSFRGSLRFKSNSQSSYSSSQKQKKFRKVVVSKNISNNSSSRKHPDRNTNRNVNRKPNNYENTIVNSPPRHTSYSISNSTNNYNSKQRGRHRYKTNKFENDDELKDYKSKIKNKFNIDYDHSLDEEYEIIEAIE
ncbi:hypothetical protein KR093_002988, partial [Drosophila rubida]